MSVFQLELALEKKLLIVISVFLQEFTYKKGLNLKIKQNMF